MNNSSIETSIFQINNKAQIDQKANIYIIIEYFFELKNDHDKTDQGKALLSNAFKMAFFTTSWRHNVVTIGR